MVAGPGMSTGRTWTSGGSEEFATAMKLVHAGRGLVDYEQLSQWLDSGSAMREGGQGCHVGDTVFTAAVDTGSSTRSSCTSNQRQHESCTIKPKRVIDP